MSCLPCLLKRLNGSIYDIKEKLSDGEYKQISDEMMEIYKMVTFCDESESESDGRYDYEDGWWECVMDDVLNEMVMKWQGV